MKILKRLLKIGFILFGIIILTGTIILWIDSLETNYLKINKKDSLSNQSYLITNVNIIPMNQDTVLVNKTVFIKEGIIQQIADTINVHGIEIIDAKNKKLAYLLNLSINLRIFFK